MNIEQKVKKILKDISKKEKILVALSGGKDSSVTAYLLKKFGYNIAGIHIDLGMGNYSKKCLEAAEKLSEKLRIKLYVYDIKKEIGSSMCYLRSSIQSSKNLKNCAICGVIKKWILNKEARRLKAGKIATGHNLDDEAETFLLNILKGNLQLSANTGVIIKNIPDKKFVPRFKPLFYITGKEIKKYSKQKNLPVVYEKCPCALDSYRIQIRNFTEKLSEREKQKIMQNFEKLQERIIKNNKELSYCEICGEPSMRKVCKKCELLKID
jgi:uncharacterized protein (TIGR00269 family)